MSRTDSTRRLALWLVRSSLAAGFLSAVADRFGFWGANGKPFVAWGDWEHFIAYTAKLNWFVPARLVPAIGWTATVLEVLLAVALIAGIARRTVAFGAAGLLLCFALTMTLAGSVKAPLDYSVFTAAAAAFLLGTVEKPRRRDQP